MEDGVIAAKTTYVLALTASADIVGVDITDAQGSTGIPLSTAGLGF